MSEKKRNLLTEGLQFGANLKPSQEERSLGGASQLRPERFQTSLGGGSQLRPTPQPAPDTKPKK